MWFCLGSEGGRAGDDPEGQAAPLGGRADVRALAYLVAVMAMKHSLVIRDFRSRLNRSNQLMPDVQRMCQPACTACTRSLSSGRTATGCVTASSSGRSLIESE